MKGCPVVNFTILVSPWRGLNRVKHLRLFQNIKCLNNLITKENRVSLIFSFFPPMVILLYKKQLTRQHSFIMITY
jgi:hypothetical protein